MRLRRRLDEKPPGERGGSLPLHVFGLGNPELVALLFQDGVDSVDSSAYLQLAVEGRLWGCPELHIEQPSATERLHLALCNLAQATQRELPLSAARLVFQTHALASRTASHSRGSLEECPP